MERGTEREREAVRERWAAIERHRTATTRLLEGLVAVLGGMVLSLWALTPELCSFTVGGASTRCTPVYPQPTATALGLLGVLVVAFGVYRCLTAIRRRPV